MEGNAGNGRKVTTEDLKIQADALAELSRKQRVDSMVLMQALVENVQRVQEQHDARLLVYAAIREALEKHREDNREIVEIDCGGKAFKTTKATLSKHSSMLCALLNMRSSDKPVFLDEDPEMFEVFLNYHRDGQLPTMNMDTRKRLHVMALKYGVAPLLESLGYGDRVETTHYVCEVAGCFSGNCTSISRLRLLDEGGVEVHYNTTPEDAFQEFPGFVDGYWDRKDDVWCRGHLSTARIQYTSNGDGAKSCAVFCIPMRDSVHQWNRFLVITTRPVKLGSVQVWTGAECEESSRTFREFRIYPVRFGEDHYFRTMLQSRSTEGFAIPLEVRPQAACNPTRMFEASFGEAGDDGQ